MAGKLVVFSFGRFNPPTVGHEKLANTVKMAAEKLGASPRIYLSHTQDKKKNPLPYDLKLKYAQAAFGPMVTASNANTIIKVLAELNTEFTDMVFIAGSDRVAEFEKLFNEYNGKGDYEFRTIRVISAGERDPDSDGVEGMSASKMRELANAGDLEGFAGGLPNKLKPAAATIMKAVRMGLGMNEGVEPHPAGYQKDVLTTPQYTLVIDTPGDLDWYKIGQHFPNLGTEDPDEYGQSDSDMSIVSANQKEMDDLKAKLDRLGLKYKEIGGTYDQPEIHSEQIGEEDDLNIKLHRELNPAIWQNGKLRPEIRETLLKIADDFKQSLGIALPGLRDITISGSNAAYNYTSKSDIDLHLVVDVPKLDQDELYRELFDAKKFKYNAEHNYKIHGYDVELYVQDSRQKHISQGIYSIKRDAWIREPKPVSTLIDKSAVNAKYELIKELIQRAAKTFNLPLANKLRDIIKKYRQAGLEAHGEFGAENLAFKALRANGYMDQLYDLLNSLQDREFSIENEEVLDEVSMSPGALSDFAKNPIAQAMTAGFEAEMIVPGLAGDDDTGDDSEPDYDMDEPMPTGRAWRDATIRFFSEGGYNSIGDINASMNTISEDYFEWADEEFNRYLKRQKNDDESNFWDAMREEFDNDTDEMDRAIEWVSGKYLNVVDKLREEFDEEDRWEEFLDELANHTARNKFTYRSFAWRYGLDWPYWTTPEPEGEFDASTLAKNWAAYSGYNAKGSSGYHSASREPGVWIFEPDSSIKGHDRGESGIELVSPPLPLSETLIALDKFWDWADTINAHSNKSTGFHMGVSLPDHQSSGIDHLKLILFLGDKYVLELFNRSNNSYTKSSLEKLKNNVGVINIAALFKEMRKGIDNIALEMFKHLVTPRGDRYLSVNIKSNYIEFRSAGGKYFQARDNIKNTLLRYVRAMAIAADPNAEKQEYAKKLYKLFGSQGLGDVNSIALFSQYAAGTLTKSELVNKVKALRGKQKADAQLATAVTPPAADREPDPRTRGNWVMRRRGTEAIISRGNNMMRQAAIDGFTRHAGVLGLGSNDWYVEPASNTDEAVELDEVNMSPGALRDFAKTPVAQSMKIGFEAEMVVPGIEYDEDDSYGDGEPDYDADEGVDSNTINSLTRDLRMFFRETTSSREVSQAVDSLNDDIGEYMDFQFTEMVTDDPETLAEKVRAQLPDDASDEDVQKSIEEQDAAYDAAFEEWRDEFYSSWDDLPGFIESENLDTMIGWHERFSWPWPYYEDGGADTSLSQESLEKVADSISLALGGVNIKADTDYHAVKRDAVTWILETDSSIKHDPGQGEAGLELVSPPMGLDEGLTKLDQFFAWAERENVTTDRSTGFHMGVSIPNQTLQNIDHLKLILFLGDEHVLQTYGRSSNTYARSSLGIMKDKISGRGVGATIKNVPLMMAQIKQGMNQLAVKSIGDTIVPRGQKYVTVNIKSGYIEFRSAGGDYLEKQDEIKNTLLRYVRAMAIAADPEAEKKEYAKKLYKLLGTTADNDIQDVITLFSVFSTGLADKSWLVSNLKRIQTARMTPKKTLYTIQDAATGTNTLHSFTTTTDEYAITHAIDWSNNPYSNVDLEKVGWQLVRHDSPNDVKGTVIKKIGGQPMNIPPEFVDVADLDEERLFEISMTPGALKDFAKTPTAQAMTIGFEAEMIVPNLQIDSDDEYDGIMVNDYDRDESLEMNYANWDTMAKSIRRFYRQNAVQDNEIIGDAVDKAERSFNSWLDVEWKTYSMTALHDWIAKKYGEDWARQLDFFADPGSSQEDQLAKRRNELAELFRKREYDNWLEKNAEDKDGQTFVDRWLVRKGISTMSEFGDEYGLRWPYMMADPDDQYYKNRISPEDLEANWSEYTGYTSTVSSGYHRGKRQAGVWTFEPDSSIHADDIGFDGIELISPPMPFAEGIEALDTFFKWAKKNRIKANESTGFHMGVSIPNQTLNNIDHLKLILFLGDQHVLKQFGRQANTYTSSSMLQLQQAIKTGSAARASMINPAKAFDLMRKGLDNQATQALNMIVPTNNRYVSVNIKPNYIEFRAAGGDYFQNINLVKDTLLRYVRAMSIAADPAAENREYAKKLYKLLSADPNNKDLNSMRLFALYATGQIDKATLKSALQAKASKQKASMPITSRTDIPTGSIKYFLYDLDTNQVLQRFTANTDQEASNYRQAVGNDIGNPNLRVRRDLEDSRDLSKKPTLSERIDMLRERLKIVKGRYALVSKSNPKKVLQYYHGPKGERPSEEWVNKVERRVHSFEGYKPSRYILENFTELQIATMLGGHTLE